MIRFKNDLNHRVRKVLFLVNTITILSIHRSRKTLISKNRFSYDQIMKILLNNTSHWALSQIRISIIMRVPRKCAETSSGHIHLSIDIAKCKIIYHPLLALGTQKQMDRMRASTRIYILLCMYFVSQKGFGRCCLILNSIPGLFRPESNFGYT